MYMCASGIEFSLSVIFLLDFGNVPTVWGFICFFPPFYYLKYHSNDYHDEYNSI
jgi:hypothetical protein